MNAPVEALQPVTLAEAARAIGDGGVVAYPTEAVFGLGCDPSSETAVQKILELKGRPAEKGLIVLALDSDAVAPWVCWDDVIRRRVAPTWPGPVTWILPASADAPAWLTRDGQLAVRVTAHPDARRLLQAWGGPLVSTSANPAGQPPARTRRQLARYFAGLVVLAPGQLGSQARPTEIRNARTGAVIRSA